MKKLFAILSVVFLAVTIIDGHAKSYYSTAGNGFGALFPNPAVRMQGRYRAIEGDRLVDENATMATALGLDTTGIRTTAYRYQLRLANTNNKPTGQHQQQAGQEPHDQGPDDRRQDHIDKHGVGSGV